MGYFTLVTVLMQVVLVTVTAFCYDLQLFITTREINASDTRLVYTCVHVLIFFYMSFLPILLSIYHDQHNQQLKYAKIFD